MENIKVSVVTPIYNCARYISKSINSIIAQTYQNWELLICDDGSTDGSLEVIRSYADTDSRIKIFSNEQNKGHVYTYNRLFFTAEGDYIMILDADDWSDPNRIERQLQTCEKYNVDLCFCASVLYSGVNEQPNCGSSHPSGFLDMYSSENFDPASIFFKREILKTIPGFHSYFDRLVAMDRYFILNCVQKFKGYYLDEPLYNTRMRPDSDHRSIDERYIRKLTALEAYGLLKKQRQETGTDWLEEGRDKDLLAYEQKLLKNKSFVSEKYRLFSCIQIDYKRTKEGWRLLKKALLLNPLQIKNYRSLLYLVKTILFK